MTETPQDRLKQIREEQNLTQKEFADRLNLNQTYISAIETGRRGVSAKLAKKLFELYGVSSEWILNGIGEKITKRSSTNYDKEPPLNEKSLGGNRYVKMSNDWGEKGYDKMSKKKEDERTERLAILGVDKNRGKSSKSGEATSYLKRNIERLKEDEMSDEDFEKYLSEEYIINSIKNDEYYSRPEYKKPSKQEMQVSLLLLEYDNQKKSIDEQIMPALGGFQSLSLSSDKLQEIGLALYTAAHAKISGILIQVIDNKKDKKEAFEQIDELNDELLKLADEIQNLEYSMRNFMIHAYMVFDDVRPLAEGSWLDKGFFKDFDKAGDEVNAEAK